MNRKASLIGLREYMANYIKKWPNCSKNENLRKKLEGIKLNAKDKRTTSQLVCGE